MIGAGARNRRIRFERAEVTQDAFGGEVRTWVKLCDAWAHVIFAKGAERREAAQERAAAAATFIVLHNPRTRDISVTDRIIFDGASWDIVSNIPSRDFNAEREIEAVRGVQ
ncbi:phage head closure protein [Sphingomonas sanxanigenens]|uniref:Head-tail adaptor protein n=1 Tax=Sphingomonas sanxanigenens DSM 19645 = NX02 TaxID=1123269 RepID=W0A828_9SPHN|nr:phage head closure protein [Sphingomonas sanxanigenens]AHE52632.1 hypothetical protein NX02_04440 [Sphingomonas sanxanigenens DSM 19645 = NX02]